MGGFYGHNTPGTTCWPGVNNFVDVFPREGYCGRCETQIQFVNHNFRRKVAYERSMGIADDKLQYAMFAHIHQYGSCNILIIMSDSNFV